MNSDNFSNFFKKVTGYEPYNYQKRLIEDDWPSFLEIPTGLGKTSAVILAWLWKRRGLSVPDKDTPRRLVYCLPMRVLVEQTFENVCKWVENAGFYGKTGEGKVSVHILMGGSEDIKKAQWVSHPQEDLILIGTQDMLISRALMRGYAMSRYQWPAHFALLNNDCIWVYDEIQLMGTALSTSAQLDAFRRKLGTSKSARSLWVSATLNNEWLNTVDMQDFFPDMKSFTLNEDEKKSENLKKRFNAVKKISKSSIVLNNKNFKEYIKNLAVEIINNHKEDTNTLVVLNTVERAQELYKEIKKSLEKNKNYIKILLVHSRFRPAERKKINSKIAEKPTEKGAIIIATQAIEAGVDISGRTLFTEIAPWSSIVQRFGRNNRYGEYNENNGSEIFWIDIEDNKFSAPYNLQKIEISREKLKDLESASPSDLPVFDEEAELHHVIRQKDFLELFNTDPDLSGFDIDISMYIRDSDDLDVQVFWRDLTSGTDNQPQPDKEEICRASLSQIKKYMERIKKENGKVYRWDSLYMDKHKTGKWTPFSESDRLYPGLVLMLDAKYGGYSADIGFDISIKEIVPAFPPSDVTVSETYCSDLGSIKSEPVTLCQHLEDVESEASKISKELGLSDIEKAVLILGAMWHDVGKAHPVFQAAMTNCPEMVEEIEIKEDFIVKEINKINKKNMLWAKSPCRGRHSRPHFRHELASMLVWLEHHGDIEPSWSPYYEIPLKNGDEGFDPFEDADKDLIAYIIAAHHGKVRMSIRSMPEEKEPEKSYNLRFARGIWEGDIIPGFDLGYSDSVSECEIRLDIMELGEGEMGLSWTDRTQRLLSKYGPFRLAWLETLLRIADWRGSDIDINNNLITIKNKSVKILPVRREENEK